MQETWVPSLGWEDPLEEGMATHSSILAWRILMDRGAQWAIYSPWGYKESDMTEQLSTTHNVYVNIIHICSFLDSFSLCYYKILSILCYMVCPCWFSNLFHRVTKSWTWLSNWAHTYIQCVSINPKLLIYPSLPTFPFDNHKFVFYVCESISVLWWLVV